MGVPRGEGSPRKGPPVPTTASEPRILVSLATYNERDNLGPLIQEIRQAVPSADILVIDDNSPDGTGDVADRLAVDDAHIRVMHRAGKLGLGTAILAGMRYAMDEDYDYLLNMDADFSHHPRYLPGIVGGMKRYDVMIGWRYIKGGGTVNWPLSRRLISRAVGYTVRLLMRISARDTSGAYRCYRVSKLRAGASGESAVARLLVPAGDAVPLPPGEVQDRRDAHHLRESPGRGVEGEPEGGGAVDGDDSGDRSGGVFRDG